MMMFVERVARRQETSRSTTSAGALEVDRLRKELWACNSIFLSRPQDVKRFSLVGSCKTVWKQGWEPRREVD
jgi:hypothetical protein